MKALSSREVMIQLKELGIHTKSDLLLYLILYKSYFSLNYCRKIKHLNGLKRMVDNYLRKFDRLHICSLNSRGI
ncbi:MAG: hypothetical protein JSW20_00110 [Nitrospiraceae bacterium]|nr:MAG: hypothetical protein JSW20_00110 [Nitrospiraceae bacterium]